MRLTFLTLTLLLCSALVLHGGRPFPQAPPPAHTGGFGEPSCHACHFGADPNPAGGDLRIEGLARVVTAGSRHHVRVVLEDDAMRVAGFQLAARFADGRQAGSFASDAADVAILAAGQPDVRYVHQTGTGSALAEAGVRRWSFVWTAPPEAGDVVLHAAANAGDGDASPFGDRVRTTELRLGVVEEK